MASKKARPKNITEYINAAPKEAQEKLREMRACILEAAPGAEESLKWGKPAFIDPRPVINWMYGIAYNSRDRNREAYGVRRVIAAFLSDKAKRR